jgi:predicted short-subunit dehydrogenase-like oxidoreductase (DUF2520 family)
MKNQRSLGLVIEGNATSSLVLKLSGLTEDLGPIKAGSLRVARRLSNYLRAGYAVGTYEELQSARLVFLRVPDSAAPRIVEELCASELALKDIAFVLCDSCSSKNVLEPLQTRGASTATLLPVQTLRRSWFVLEGQVAAVRQVKRLLERYNARVFELRPGTRALYFAAQLLATALPVPLFITAQQALRAAGISGNRLHDLLEEMSLEMFRSFANGVRPVLPAGRTGCSAETCSEYFNELASRYPEISSVLCEHIGLTLRQRGDGTS